MNAVRAFAFVSTLALYAASLACGGAGAVTPAAGPAAGGSHPFKAQAVEYKEGATVLEGYLAYPTDIPPGTKRPAVVVFHDWMGLGPGPKKRAEELAQLGYVAFAGDIYGKGQRPANNDEAAKLAGTFKNDRGLMRARARAALAHVSSDPRVDASKVAAMGYCFGGTAALELGRSGAPLAGIVSFHGGLATPHPEDAKNIKGRVLALHGADDPFVKSDEVLGFEQEMRQAGVDWQLVAYGGAVHAFAVKEAGSDASKGAAYNAKADARSWADMQQFFSEVLK
ncbi:MAG: dienelactone hydrolase family protein [Polyangiaceae bacterium]